MSQTRIFRKDGTSAGCGACGKIQQDEWYKLHSEKELAKKKAAYAANPERSKVYKLDNWRGEHNRHLKRNYGISYDEYERMLDAQNYVCAACKREELVKGRRLAVDHDHATGVVRGLLCSRCNSAVGLLGDSPGIIAQLLDYVKKYRQLQLNLPRQPIEKEGES